MSARSVMNAVICAAVIAVATIAIVAPIVDRSRSAASSAPVGSASAIASGRTPARSPTPVPTPMPTLPPVSIPVPVFHLTPAPYSLVLEPACVVEYASLRANELGALWRIQCGSAAANLRIASGADSAGWHFESGDRPDGFQNFAQGDLLMQIVYRRDGPAAADPVTVAQQFRQSALADAPHELPIGPRCGTFGPSTVGGGDAHKWLGRCGGDMRTAFDDLLRLMPTQGYTRASATDPTYNVLAWCGRTEVIVRSGGDLGPGVFALTQTPIASARTYC